MIRLKVFRTAAVLVLALAVPTASFAQQTHGARAGGGGGARAGGGGFHGGAPGAARFSGGGGGFRGGGGYGNRGGGGFFPGAVAGAVIGGALASGAYYSGPGYYAPGYYDDQYENDAPVAVVQGPGGGDDSAAYCMQTYRSYDPRSGTYAGYDGMRHPCP